MVKNLKAIFLFLFMINISLFFFACANNGGNYNISEPEEIRLSKTSLNLLVGQSETLTVNTYKNVVWESENEYIASVSGGTVVGITEGTANVYAKIGSTVLTCQVTVTETPAGVPSLVLDQISNVIVICKKNGIGSTTSNSYTFQKNLYGSAGTQTDMVPIANGGGDLPLPNCDKYDELAGLLSALGINLSITEPFDSSVWEFAPEARPALIKNNCNY